MLVGMALKELLKVDLDKDKEPDAVEALEALDKGLDAAAGFLSKFNEGDLVNILNLLNNAIGGKLSQKEVADGAHELASLGPKLKAFDVIVEAAAKELEKRA